MLLPTPVLIVVHVLVQVIFSTLVHVKFVSVHVVATSITFDLKGKEIMVPKFNMLLMVFDIGNISYFIEIV